MADAVLSAREPLIHDKQCSPTVYVTSYNVSRSAVQQLTNAARYVCPPSFSTACAVLIPLSRLYYVLWMYSN